MKNLKKTAQIMMAILAISISSVKAQDMIVTVKGKTINAHVKKVKAGNIVYVKHYFQRKKIPTYKVLYVQYGNGTKTVYNSVTTVKNYTNYTQLAKNSTVPQTTDSTANKAITKVTQGAGATHKYYIERIGANFRLDTNQFVGTKGINQIMEQSGNPIVLADLKAAKTIRLFTTLTQIAAVPSSSGGAYSSYVTFSNLFKQLKAGPAPFGSYLKAGLSFTLTMSLPITAGILKHIQNKLYDRTLTMYSAGN